MEEVHKKILTKNQVFMVQQLSDVAPVLDFLLQEEVFSDEQVAIVKAEVTPQSKVRKLLELLPSRGRRGYNTFITALERTGQKHIAQPLKKIDPTQTKMYNIGPARLLCITNIEFNAPDVALSYRGGAEQDSRKLEKTFKELGFQDNESHKNLSLEEMRTTIKKFVNNGSTARASSVVFMISSHGEKNGVYSCDGHLLHDEEILDAFDATLPSLKGKPKLLIFQACRLEANSNNEKPGKASGEHGKASGEHGKASEEPVLPGEEPVSTSGDPGSLIDKPVLVSDTDTASDTTKTVQNEHDAVPLSPEQHGQAPKAQDRIIARATMEGDSAMRNTVHGSWFISAICDKLREEGDSRHVLDILTLVNNEVKNRPGTEYQSMQLPTVETTLSKDWYLV